MEQLFTSDEWNTLEISMLAPEARSGPIALTHELQILPVCFDKMQWNRWMQKIMQWKNVRSPKSFKLREYYYLDLIDQYDHRDDTHRILQKNYSSDFMPAPNLYAVAFRQDQLPEYRFPNVKDLSSIATRNRTSFWHTNRIAIHFDETEWCNAPPVYTITVHVTCQEKVDRDTLFKELQDLILHLAEPAPTSSSRRAGCTQKESS